VVLGRRFAPWWPPLHFANRTWPLGLRPRPSGVPLPPRRISVRSGAPGALPVLLVAGWTRPIAAALARQLFAFTNEAENRIVTVASHRVMIADCVGPAHDFSFIAMPFAPTFIVDDPPAGS
jgi:hypothetical protein